MQDLTHKTQRLSTESLPERRFYLNPPQQRSAIIEAQEEYAVWGRGTGKSEGLLAPRLLTWMTKMPRSLIGLVASTYQQHLTRTLPAIIRGWERMGFKRDRDFFIGKTAPESWGWDLPFFMPLKKEYFVHWNTGAGIVLISQDRPGSANGLSLDAIAGDEAKFLDKQKLDSEVFPAMRGNYGVFGELSCYQAICFATDMPTSSAAEWILDKREGMDEMRIKVVLSLQADIASCIHKIRSGEMAESTIEKLRKEIVKYERQLNELRKGDPDNGVPPLIYYSEASSLENIDILRPQWYDKQRRGLNDFLFRTSILNERVVQVKDGFYPDLDQLVHGYTDFDNSYLDSLGYDFDAASLVDSRQDADVHPHEPLDVAFDYGGNFNCMLVGQPWPVAYRFLKNFYRPMPDKLRDVVLDFKKYYRHHKKKTVRFFYDHTAVGVDGIRTQTYQEEVEKLLREDDEYGKWTVIKVYIGQQPGYDERHRFWSEVLRDDTGKYPSFRYNVVHCQEWADSCMRARAKMGSRGIEKDKSDERKRDSQGFKVPQQKATHLSDAGDTLLFGALITRPKGKSSGLGGMMIR